MEPRQAGGRLLVRTELVRKLWRDMDPLRGFPKNLFAFDIQGWNSSHPYLITAIDEARPSIVVEIGVWKGASTLAMAARLKQLELDAVVIPIDTWLGSYEHWHSDEYFELMDMRGGRANLYEKFLGNVAKSGLSKYVVPLPLDSINACRLLGLFNINPDVIHIDGCHDYSAVSADLRAWWPRLKSGGTLICDDYYETGAWQEVRTAVDDFFRTTEYLSFEHLGGKCRAKKPA